MDKVFDIYIDFLKNTPTTAIGFANEGGYIGGVEGKFSKGFGRNCCGTIIFKSDNGVEYLGTQSEDLNIALKYFYKIFFEIYGVSYFTSQRGQNTGGNNYKEIGMYVTNFYSIILAPSCLKLKTRKNNITLYRKWNNAVPKIISEVYKK